MVYQASAERTGGQASASTDALETYLAQLNLMEDDSFEKMAAYRELQARIHLDLETIHKLASTLTIKGLFFDIGERTRDSGMSDYIPVTITFKNKIVLAFNIDCGTAPILPADTFRNIAESELRALLLAQLQQSITTQTEAS
ncbi:hypothetical protein KBC89_04650 [Candidatus Woesebacteria bacterium]|nr:hypothetical protein [Candidatus Woesebacteria bacterium]